jgi:hypothetical membrane protein
MVEGAIAYAVGALLVLHAVRPDYAVCHRFLSEYAVGPFGLVMTTVFAVLGAAMLLLAARLRAVRRALAVAAGVCGLALLTLAAFPTDLNDGSAKTPHGTVHDIVSLGMFVVVMGMMFVVGFRRDNELRSLRVWGRVLGPACLLVYATQLALVAAQHPAPKGFRWVGLTERLLIAMFLVWVLAIHRLGARGDGQRMHPE